MCCLQYQQFLARPLWTSSIQHMQQFITFIAEVQIYNKTEKLFDSKRSTTMPVKASKSIINIIMKCICIMQNREKLQMRWVTVTNETGMSQVCFWTSPTRCLVYEVQQEDCSTPEVLGQRSCSRRSLFWCVEQSIGWSKRMIKDAGWQLHAIGSCDRDLLHPSCRDTMGI